MPTTYTLKFKNEHETDGNYAFCTEKPVVNGSMNDPKVIVNVWIAKFIPDGSNVKIVTTNEYYAWCGKAPQSPAPGIVIEEGNSMGVNLGSTKNDGDSLKMVINQGSPVFEKPATKTANAGCYSISQGKDFAKEDNVLIGFALKDDKGDVVPAASILADQNMTTNIQPIVKYYISKVSLKRGTIVNWQGFSTDAGVVDFTNGAGQGKFIANIKHTKNGDFAITYE